MRNLTTTVAHNIHYPNRNIHQIGKPNQHLSYYTSQAEWWSNPMLSVWFDLLSQKDEDMSFQLKLRL